MFEYRAQKELIATTDGPTKVFACFGIRTNGDVVFEGQDLGAAPTEAFGDSEYEYWVLVDQADRPLLETLLAERAPVEDDELLSLLAAHFPQATMSTIFRKWLEENEVPHRFLTM